jgi:inosine-uridine nucleoside N-ribohydrolase
MARPILLDVNTGTDDALGILYAVRHPDLAVLGISCVAGNSGVDQVVTNTLKILDAAGARSDLPSRAERPSRWSSAPGPRAPSTAQTASAEWSCPTRPGSRAS